MATGTDRKVVLFIAMSLDGYIAKEDDNIEFLDTVDAEGEDYGYFDFIKSIDTVIIGRKTYDKVSSFEGPFWHKERNCHVISRSRTGKNDDVTFFNGAPSELIAQLREKEGKNIYVDGGNQVIAELFTKNLIDEMTISVIPYLLGKGIPLFGKNEFEIPLVLVNSKSYPSGLTQLTYRRK